MKLTAILLLAATIGIAGSAAAQNLIVNGDFSGGNNGFSSGYVYSPGNLLPASTYDTVADVGPDNPYSGPIRDHTTGTGLMLALNGSGSANTLAWSETVNVTSGTSYQFSGWAGSWGYYYQPIDPSPAVLQITVNGQPQGAAFTLNSADGHWQNFNFLWTAVSAQVTIQVYDLNLASGGNDFALDDLSFQVVPEPSSLALMGLVGGACSIRRMLRTH